MVAAMQGSCRDGVVVGLQNGCSNAMVAMMQSGCRGGVAAGLQNGCNDALVAVMQRGVAGMGWLQGCRMAAAMQWLQ